MVPWLPARVAAALLPSLPYPQALLFLAITQLTGATYLHLVSPVLRPGVSRVVAALPVIAANLAAPRLFDRHTAVTTIVLVAFNIAWLSTFKALLWAVGRSALASRRLRGAQFCALLLAPLTPVAETGAGRRAGGRLHEAAPPPKVMLAVGAAKLALLGAIAAALQRAALLPDMLLSFLYGMALFTLLSSIMDGPGAAMSQWLGIPVSPHFDRPWLSTSVASFWNRRWDLAAGNVLRQLIFDPIMEGRLVKTEAEAPTSLKPGAALTASPNNPATGLRDAPSAPSNQPKDQQAAPAGAIQRPPALRQLLAMLVSFTVSGLVHECIFWYLTGRTSGGRWLAFFVVQVPAIAAERATLGMLRSRGIEVPHVLLGVYVVSFVVWTGARLFWAPAEEAGLATGVVGNVRECYWALLQQGGEGLHAASRALAAVRTS